MFQNDIIQKIKGASKIQIKTWIYYCIKKNKS